MLKYFKEEEASLRASFSFSDFVGAFSFMTAVALLAERLKHHPNWTNVYNKVDIVLTTHDANNTITALDYKLAAEIEKIAANYL